MAWQSLIVSEHQTQNNKVILHITLNEPQRLNALSSVMIDELTECLEQAQKSLHVACVWIEGAGEKAFCAGGDIRTFYDHAQSSPSTMADFAHDFFAREYALDYQIHTYPKPIICWADGVVMGGGIGLMAGSDFRLVTERTLWAMPEINIGLFPDVGGSWFLNRLPARLGLWLGLTGSRLHAHDLVLYGLAEQVIAAHEQRSLLSALQEIAFSGDKFTDCQEIDTVLSTFVSPVGTLVLFPQVHQEIAHLVRGFSLSAIATRFEQWQSDNAWIASGLKAFTQGSALSHHLVWRQFHTSTHQSLQDVFATELTLAVNCCTQGDFIEGVRALLVDKDKKPDWKYKHVDALPQGVIERFYTLER